MKETPMQQLLNQLREERSKLPLPAEWGRCYQAIEMVIETTYLPMEQQEISDEEIDTAAHRNISWGGGSEGWIKDGFRKGAKWYREQVKQEIQKL
jgi:hypothetical protein